MKSANAPFNEFGQSMILRDIEDLYIDVSNLGQADSAFSGDLSLIQQSITSINASLASLVVFGASGASHSTGLVPDPGAVSGTALFLREDATWAAPTGATASVNRAAAGTQTVASGVSNATITTWTAIGTATLTGFNTTSGVFTAPATGLYLITAYLFPSYSLIGTGLFDFYVDYNNLSSPDATLGRWLPYQFNSAATPPVGGMSGMKFLTSGDTLRLRLSNLGANTITVADAHFNIARLA